MSLCKKCGRELIHNEIALHKRMIGKAEESFFCITCLSEFFGCSEDLLNKKIEHFKKSGCLLFADAQK